MRTKSATISTIPQRQPVAIRVVRDGGALSPATAKDKDSFLAYATVFEDGVVKYGNEERYEYDPDLRVQYVGFAALKADPEAALAEVTYVSTCQHIHDQEISGLSVSWYFRRMKPGATSYSGICEVCNTNAGCLGRPHTVAGKNVGVRTTLDRGDYTLSGCGDIRAAAREAAKALAKAEAEAAAASKVAEAAMAEHAATKVA
jgi:hypothetical protein